MTMTYHAQVADLLPPGTESIKTLAKRLDLTVRSVSSYLARGVLPEPDYRVGKSPLWKTETIEEWERTRLGRGWRGNLRRYVNDAGEEVMLGVTLVGPQEVVVVPVKQADTESSLRWTGRKGFTASAGSRIQGPSILVPVDEWDKRMGDAS